VTDPSCMSFWYPRLLALHVPADKKTQQPAKGIPMPKTELVDAGEDWIDMYSILDSPKRFPTEWATADKKVQEVSDRLMVASTRLGDAPFFLRTGLTSGKHNWSKCCYLPDRFPKTFYDAVHNLIDDSGCKGLDFRHWAVREYLPVLPLFRLDNYGGMPLVPEIRVFTKGGEIRGHQPYWPKKSIEAGRPNCENWEPLYKQGTEACERAWENPDSGVKSIALQVAKALPEHDWSIDLLLTTRGWYVTDLAIAGRSHFEAADFIFEEGMS
jgi:hypothetical protein